MKKLLFFVVLIFVSVFSFHNSRASWYAPQGLPADVHAHSFFALGDSLLVSTAGNVYYTTDDGKTWGEFSYNYYYYGGNITIVRDTVLFALGSDYISLSFNRGRNWQQGYAPSGVQIYAAAFVGDTIFAATNNGVYNFTDSSGYRIAKQNGLMGLYVGAITAAGDTLLAGTYGGGIFRSTDYGAHWSAADTGLTDPYVDLMASFGDTIYCVTDSSMYFSPNGGAIWSDIGNGLKGIGVHSFAKYGGSVYATTDSGVFVYSSGWRAENAGLKDDVNAVFLWNGNMYAGTNAGVYISPASANLKWNPVAMTLNGSDIFTLIAKDTELFAGTLEGFVYRSTNNGDSWFIASKGLPLHVEINSLAVKDSFLFAAVWGAGIYRSSDNGATWELQDRPDSATIRGDVTLVFVNGQTVYAGTYNGIYYSTDDGASWRLNNQLKDIESMTINNGRLYASETYNLYRLMDDSVHWELVYNGSPNFYFDQLFSYDSDLYVSTGNGVYRSTDSGASWTAENKGLPLNVSASCFASNDSDLFAGDFNNGVFVSTNNGRTWVPINDGFQYNIGVRDLIVSNGYLFAAMSYYGGVYRRPLYEILSGVQETPAGVPSDISLANYPNPFSNTTTIEYSLPQRERVTLKVFDALGREIATLVDGERDAGAYNVPFLARGLQNGAYFYRLIEGPTVRTGTMVMAR